jgi:hypothetical protein
MGKDNGVVLKHYAPASASTVCPTCGLPQGGMIQHFKTVTSDRVTPNAFASEELRSAACWE